MPKHFEFVFAAYGIWVLTFAVYLAYVVAKGRAARRALRRLAGPSPTSR